MEKNELAAHELVLDRLGGVPGQEFVGGHRRGNGGVSHAS